MPMQNRFRGALFGLACGDAVGTTVEFKRRGTFAPVTDMVGGGPFRLRPGEWTDDTSMALCLATSLVEKHGFDPADQMNRYLRWMQDGYLASNGVCFDIGTTVARALNAYRKTENPYSGPVGVNTAGNGCIMRLAPVPMYCIRNRQQAIEWSGESSRTTHGAAECIDACRLFGAMLHAALSGADKEEILLRHGLEQAGSAALRAIARGDYRCKTAAAIRGSGYVVECLEAALWCFYRTDSFSGAVLMAANLGHDADTTAAVCGQLAGAYYGETGIPQTWLHRVAKKDEIRQLADRLFGPSNPEAMPSH